MQNQTGPQGGVLPTALELISALTEAQYQQLHRFAAKRLQRLAGSPGRQRLRGMLSSGDLVNQAIEKVLLGDQHPGKGRALSARNRQSLGAFLACLTGIINSDLSTLVNSAEARCEHLPMPPEGEAPLTTLDTDRSDPLVNLERQDLKEELFLRLHQETQDRPELRPIIDHWETHYLEDHRIARRDFDRRQVWRLRQMARAILAELAREVQPASPSGMEMLL